MTAHRDVSEAFELLLSELSDALKEIREQAAEAVRRGNNEAVRDLLPRTEQIEKIAASVRALHKQWKQTLGRRRGRRTAGKRQPRAPRGTRTHERAYRLPILRALKALGGEGKVRDVLDRVHDEIKGQLKPIDLQRLPSGSKMPRWRNAAMWERLDMVKEGLLRDDSPRGTWALTERGRDYLRRQE